MQTFTTAVELSGYLSAARKKGERIGFVPTMGALHPGHAALIQRSAAEQAVTVASIFVNPTQFNVGSDLLAYPRTPEADSALLTAHGCNLLYMPGIEDVYPAGTGENRAANLDFGSLTARMEGAYRPGHFAGVAQVVSRLLEIVGPDVLYLGQKDYQQVAVVRRMIELLGLGIEVVTVPTVREADGLALSSRNRLLQPQERTAAGRINLHLAAVAAGIRAGWPARELEKTAVLNMRSEPLLEPEYVEVVDGRTLLPYQDGDSAEELIVATAVQVGRVRLIDNRIIGPANP
ncbi:pantoate--beta-alanine ligase [Lewinella aquimaris]|uniref:Pantothenate synthetase n=1 Tax=Neolewinella aquimaris TaxID=1835722 RepID=A0A840E343_9BACT|nr:pantoate--beta-alanine ligase [Neolewinella aquimaris]MBB4078383.1 pantoate--beta-alanine ligase [Neolewinella aquimaris]